LRLIAKYILLSDLKREREGLGVAHIWKRIHTNKNKDQEAKNTILGNAKKGEV
jgi:hypothetical protein